MTIVKSNCTAASDCITHHHWPNKYHNSIRINETVLQITAVYFVFFLPQSSSSLPARQTHSPTPSHAISSNYNYTHTHNIERNQAEHRRMPLNFFTYRVNKRMQNSLCEPYVPI